MLHALQGSTALDIPPAPQCYILLSVVLPWRGTRCPQPQLKSVGDKETCAAEGLREVTQADAQPNREAGGAARDICLNSRGQSLAQGY